MNNSTEKILVLDFGGQYNQLIARRVRDLNVYAEIKPYTVSLETIAAQGYKGIIFTGGPNSVYADGSPSYDSKIFELGIPILGICYGAQLMAHLLGGTVTTAPESEYGRVRLLAQPSELFASIPANSLCWMSHTDYIQNTPDGFEITASTGNCPCAAMENPSKKLYAVQFHPEVTHTEYGKSIIKRFLYEICKCSGDWIMSGFVAESIEHYRNYVGEKKVLLGLSGGVDSSVAALLMHKAVGDKLTCIFVDHGLLRKNEGDEVERIFCGNFGLNVIRVNAKERFLAKLEGVTEPEKKRKIIGNEFIRVFEEESRKLGKINYLVQGTIYPDVIESGMGSSAMIKSHHNVGGLPSTIDFEEIVEPLRMLFKDEVRRVGVELGLPSELVYRQPFPGPGLAVRIIGAVTEEKLDILSEADEIFREEIAMANLQNNINQYFAVLTDTKSVGVMGDARTYAYTIALRAVTTDDFMTADWARIPYEVLAKASQKIVNSVKGVNRVVYDITSKPPATVEWE